MTCETCGTCVYFWRSIMPDTDPTCLDKGHLVIDPCDAPCHNTLTDHVGHVLSRMHAACNVHKKRQHWYECANLIVEIK